MTKETQNLIKSCEKLKKNYIEGKAYSKDGWKSSSGLKASIEYGKSYEKFRKKFGYEKPLPKECRFKLSKGKATNY
ncbi:MAG: hypothetical protein KKB88_00465 [Nanoarchaeota archaeon]|nr:hypothetical protein [Nanoarchaeota archaeon]